MGLLNERLHGFLDLATVVIFILAPFVFGLGGYVAAVAWGLAAVHLLMTLLTRFPLGIVKVTENPLARKRGDSGFVRGIATLSDWRSL